MVMVGLSLLGLGFVAISETESAIAINERNAAQVLATAEAGARTVVDWFNNPKWALAAGIMPANDSDFKQFRRGGLGVDSGGTVIPYEGYYKPNASDLLFDLPYKPEGGNRFFGLDEVSADVKIDRSTADGRTFLDTFNQRLFRDNVEGGRIIEILVYAPPVLNPPTPAFTTVTGPPDRRYWNGGTRYGVATIKVTAQKTNPPNCTPGVDTPCALVAQRSVKLVISEFPFPGPEGPLQSNTGITTNGAFRVHWGKIISLGDLALKREMISIPWQDAWTPVRYEWGYDNPAYAHLKLGGEPDYLFELVNKTFEDPWFQARARNDITSDGGVSYTTTDPCVGCQPYPYTSVNQAEDAAGPAGGGWSNQFQGQDHDSQFLRRTVIFPRIEYRFWKQVAISSTGQSGIFYLQYDPGTGRFKDRAGNVKTFAQWVNTVAGAKEGFYFFDTIDGTNPQRSDGSTDTTKLTPAISLNSSDGNPFQMKGFIYLNAVNFGSTGIDGPSGYYNAPGEPFRDIGYWKVNETTGARELTPLGQPLLVNDTNYQWDYQDLPLSSATGGTFSAGGVKNGKFDYALEFKAVTPPGSDTPAYSDWFIIPYSPGCNVGTDCSEPHEPYLNLISPGSPYEAVTGSGDPVPMRVRWHAKTDATLRRPKVLSGGTPITCTVASTEDECTHAGYDKVGGLLKLDSGSRGPILDGVFYNEGGYDSTGNAIYFGSVVVRGLASKAGTVDVWFDGRLATGNWQERFKNLARVLITSHETDQ
ncbi:MAG TPA: hypothetical protein VNL91_09330 [Thermoanaerobaculia bacterium]|nr:hypothetical protein [Thermoanaerobaculia bacterium]